MTDIVQALVDQLGADGVVTADRLRERATSYWDASPTTAKCLLRPASTDELSRAMRICHARRQSVVVQGGLTGVVAGAVASADDVIVSLERMQQIERVDELDGVAVIQAGAVLQTVQEALAAQGFLFPLDFGARGSATVGGATATNAGGLNVLRYGMARNLILGLEAVLADGTVVSSLNQMLKNNTGYDLKQLFIGSEGTLGIVTRVVMRLYPLCTSRQTALLALDSFAAVVATLQRMRAELAGTLSAFEVMWNDYYASMTSAGRHTPPLGRDHAYYVLVEAEGYHPDADDARFEALLAEGLERGEIVDAVLPKSDTERAALWAIREEFEPLLPAYLYDVSMPIAAMTTYAARLEAAVRAWRDDARAYVFGHIADGNLHIFVTPHDDGIHHEHVDKMVYGSLDGLAGSVSAEHGIGKEKIAWLGNSRSPEEIRLMRDLKAMLDPLNLLNPGNVLP